MIAYKIITYDNHLDIYNEIGTYSFSNTTFSYDPDKVKWQD